MQNKLHSLLVGIDSYPSPFELSGCSKDVHKIATYLSDLSALHPEISLAPSTLILDEQGTKSNIVAQLQASLSQLQDGDTFLFYCSGHGAEEISDGRFLEDHNGLLQGFVCYHTNHNEENFLLADKEIRYVLNNCTAKAHIVAIFDCCHSGDISRGITAAKKIKRMAVQHPQREYSQFIFSKEADESSFETQRFSEVFPDKNYVVISACQSNQSAWEGSEGGVFTEHLLQSLSNRENHLNYSELVRTIELSIRHTTQERQTPTISVHGDGSFGQRSSWLSLYGNVLASSGSSVQFNKKMGWVFNKGSINGVQNGDLVTLTLPSEEETKLAISQVNLVDAHLEDPMLSGVELDPSKKYPAYTPTHKVKPLFGILNIDHDLLTENTLRNILADHNEIQLTSSLENCDYHLVIFNDVIYTTFPNQPYQPLHKQYDLLDEDKDEGEILEKLEHFINYSLSTICKYYHYQHLKIDDGFLEVPIEIEFRPSNTADWEDITNGTAALKNAIRHPGNKLLFGSYEIKITNTSNENLHITVLALITSLHEISAYPFEERTIMLAPGASKSFENAISIDHYQEIYNWEKETVSFRCIVNNHIDLTSEIPSMLQDGLIPPISHLGNRMGAGGMSHFNPPEKNAIYSAEVSLINPTLNVVSGALVEKWDWYESHELLSPFMERLYFNVDSQELTNKPENKPISRLAKSRGGFKITLGNMIDATRRNRRFRRMRRRHPDKKVIVAEGDSWFLYPILVKDTIDYIMEDRPVKSLAWAGDTLENYKKSGDVLKAIKKYDPAYVLISGGGNDIIGAEIVHLLKDNVTNAQQPTDYLNDKFQPQIEKLASYYSYFFDEISKANSVEKILVHGYDYIRADHATIVVKDGWLNRYLLEKGIHDMNDRDKLIRYLIDTFNQTLEHLASQYPKAVYLDMRGKVAKDQWYDEIHPNDHGYKTVADAFLAEMK